MNMQIPLVLMTLFLAATAFNAPAAVVTLTTADGDGADSYIDQNAPGTNFGNATRMFTRTSTAEETDKDKYEAIFVRFDISGYVSGSFTGSATLGLVKWRDDESSSDLRIFGLNEANDTWVEGDGGTDDTPAGELTYNNAPGIEQDAVFDDDMDIDASETTDLGSVSPAGDEGDVIALSNAAVLNFLNADTDGLVTFIVARAADDRGVDDFAAKETTALATQTGQAGDFAPSLTFDGQPIPEPGTLALLGLGGLAGVIRRRRR